MLIPTLPAGTPRIVAVYSFRYDAHLVPAMLANVAPLVDGSIGWDDRAADGAFSDEPVRRIALLEAARETGAQWALAVDPDERFETALHDALPGLLDGEADAYSFALRELYSPARYRVDGIWGTKRQARLLRLSNAPRRPEHALHVPWDRYLDARDVRATDWNLYHLKMIDPRRRAARAALYERLDPDHRMQAVGYGYLADEQGMALERIPAGRGYRPRHREDGGLWMP